MTPRRDPEEDMSMEEILASIRKFVTENHPENPQTQKVYKGDISESVVIPPAGHARNQDYQVDSIQPSPLDLNPSMSPDRTAPPAYEPDILELNSPLPQTPISNPIPQMRATPEHLAPWTPPSRTPFQKKSLEESIMTLTNPIGSGEKLNRANTKPLLFGGTEESFVSSQAIAASANSLTRLAQASKSAPKKVPSLADQRNVTLDQLIQDLIRPMIKQWIDTHLPSLVEEMVAKEIKRITKHLG